ncbi:phosphoribosyltransferase [Roseobacter sp. YSTF-M11]|uniref:Phosphoribosyltransferase n=1 Tax=Roseobacter insulae TaxID=2859783 RepID=A0A9X1FSG0_9RHOB|nr:phosphoribosyltransferase family protein [Roseobacter insulae]MBW4706818.1 phosphoribosyltransferase [Roseobacter insulae]
MSSQPVVFKDRTEAGRRLADALPALDPAETVVIALPRGGVPVAVEICAAYDLPLDLVLVRKIGAPGQPELAVGAITNGDAPQVTVNESVARHFGLSRQDVEERGYLLLPEIARRRQSYLHGRTPLALKGKTVVVVDDGVATGATLRASLAAVQTAEPKRVIVALPVGPQDLAEQLHDLADDIICLSDLRYFGAVGGAYRSFPQTTDAEVRAAIDHFAPRAKA